ncbi:hypothetical protein [Altererythrobacter sp. BO-6]|uniref:hypothetical protein n=1 Tax=Altererythrobacter sp. BO-6 TaxID=2604537 RepID=UPI001F497300|nr:hypothetical protein [Altererythrobacter sp. BO-6]
MQDLWHYRAAGAHEHDYRSDCYAKRNHVTLSMPQPIVILSHDQKIRFDAPDGTSPAPRYGGSV